MDVNKLAPSRKMCVKTAKLAPSRGARRKTARYLATCYFCNETIESAANAADKNRMFFPLAPLLRASFTFPLPLSFAPFCNLRRFDYDY